MTQITPIPINELPNATTITGNEPTAIFQGGRAVQAPVSAFGQGFNQGFVTVGGSAAPLPNARALTAQTPIAMNDMGPGNSLIIEMASVANGTVISNVSGSANPSVPNSISAVLDAIGSTRGSILYRGASGWAILAPGTNGQVLTSHGAGSDPTWV